MHQDHCGRSRIRTRSQSNFEKVSLPEKSVNVLEVPVLDPAFIDSFTGPVSLVYTYKDNCQFNTFLHLFQACCLILQLSPYTHSLSFSFLHLPPTPPKVSCAKYRTISGPSPHGQRPWNSFINLCYKCINLYHNSCKQGCGSGSAWIRIHFPFLIQIRIQFADPGGKFKKKIKNNARKLVIIVILFKFLK